MLCSFFQLALGLDISNSSILTLIPYLAMIAATPFVGALKAQRNGLVVPYACIRAHNSARKQLMHTVCRLIL